MARALRLRGPAPAHPVPAARPALRDLFCAFFTKPSGSCLSLAPFLYFKFCFIFSSKGPARFYCCLLPTGRARRAQRCAPSEGHVTAGPGRAEPPAPPPGSPRPEVCGPGAGRTDAEPQREPGPRRSLGAHGRRGGGRGRGAQWAGTAGPRSPARRGPPGAGEPVAQPRCNGGRSKAAPCPRGARDNPAPLCAVARSRRN